MSYQDIQSNPYINDTQDIDPGTKPLDEIIRMAIAAAMIDLRVHLPAMITVVRGNQRVDVQPMLKTRYADGIRQPDGTMGTVVLIPVIQNVMVSMPQGRDYSIKLPLAVGDTGNLLFCDRSLDIFSASNGQEIIDPQDSRTHDICDPIFIPGLVPFAQQTTDSTTDLVITNSQAQLRVQKAGTFQLKNGTAELIDLLDQLMDTLINKTFTNTLLGPQPFIASTALLLQDIKTKLDTLKGS